MDHGPCWEKLSCPLDISQGKTVYRRVVKIH
jgi:hypothetical protein